MEAVTQLFRIKFTPDLRWLHTGIVIFLIGIVAFIYYELQYSWLTISALIPFTYSMVVWEYNNNLIGSLFYIPMLYSIFFFSRRGLLIVWLVSIALILPRLILFYFTYINYGSRIFIDIFYLSVPILALSYLNIELKWRNREKRIYEEREKDRQDYLAQVFKAQEQERKRIAQEIHDDSIQRLAVLAGNAKNLLNEDYLNGRPDIKLEVESIQITAISVAEDLRRISLDLRPATLDDLGLVPALRWLVNSFRRENKVDAQIEIIGNCDSITPKASIHYFRIVQEALNNIKRHAEASQVLVTVHCTEANISITVRDNGKGFSFPATESEFTTKGRLGLIGMKQRAQFLEGNFVCYSEIGKGTTISIESKL